MTGVEVSVSQPSAFTSRESTMSCSSSSFDWDTAGAFALPVQSACVMAYPPPPMRSAAQRIPAPAAQTCLRENSRPKSMSGFLAFSSSVESSTFGISAVLSAGTPSVSVLLSLNILLSFFISVSPFCLIRSFLALYLSILPVVLYTSIPHRTCTRMMSTRMTAIHLQ